MKKFFKQFINYIALIIVFLPWLTWKIERILFQRNSLYLFWAQFFALIPGIVGNFLRRAFYHLVFPECSWECEIGFGTFFSQPWAIIKKGVYIGPYCIIGKTILEEGVLIASRVSIPSGKRQHKRRNDGTLTPADENAFETIHIGAHSWIGEGAIIMADLENFVTVAAGSVVTQPVCRGCIVAGNPAKIIRKLEFH